MESATVSRDAELKGILHVLYKIDAERQRFNIMQREHDGLDKYGPINEELLVMREVWDDLYETLSSRYDRLHGEGD